MLYACLFCYSIGQEGVRRRRGRIRSVPARLLPTFEDDTTATGRGAERRNRGRRGRRGVRGGGTRGGAEGEARDEAGRVGGGDGRGTIPEETIDGLQIQACSKMGSRATGSRYESTPADLTIVGDGEKRCRHLLVTADLRSCGEGTATTVWRTSRHRLVTVYSRAHGYMLLVGRTT